MSFQDVRATARCQEQGKVYLYLLNEADGVDIVSPLYKEL